LERDLGRDAWQWLGPGLICIALAAVCLPTVIYPYLLSDEGWIVRPGTYSWTFSMGRPLFSLFGWISARIGQSYGMGVVYALRGSGILGLALAAWFLARWLETCGHDRWSALGIAFATMTLPAYQIVVADGTQLAFAIFFAVLGTLWFHRALERRSMWLFAASAALFLAALLIYQQQALVALALLAVLLLKRPGDRHAQLVAFLGGAFVMAVTAAYFLAWRVVYWLVWPGRVDTRYGPDAVAVPGLDQIRPFLETRLAQVANLWHVEGYPALTWIVALVIVLAVVKIVHDLWSARRRAVLSYALVVGLLVGADSFRLVAHSFPSYVTAPALSLIVFYWAFSGAAVLLGRRATPIFAAGLAVLGGVLAFITLRDEVAIPNWREFATVRAAFLRHPEAESFHLVGVKRSGPGFQEFGWRNSGTDVYLDLLAQNVADDLVLKGALARARRERLYISTGEVYRVAPASHPSEPKPDSVVVRLD
jgi:MFS family permease